MVSSFSEQVRRLEALVGNATLADVLICHSQGCVIAALATLPKFRNVIFIAPPPYTSVENFMQRIVKRRGSKYPNGIWSFPSSRGATRWIPQTYLDELAATDIIPRYVACARAQDLVIFTALDDEILKDTDVSMIPANNKELPGDHNFTGESRAVLLREIASLV